MGSAFHDLPTATLRGSRRRASARPAAGAGDVGRASEGRDLWLHEAPLSWLPGLDEGGPNLKRIDAGDRGIQQALAELAVKSETR
jgi:hypothetical protein